MANSSRPHPSEYAPYYGRYINLVPDGSIVDLLERQLDMTSQLLGTVGEKKADYRYATGKWSIKEVVGHVTDTERVFAFRAFSFSRDDKNPLPSFEQDEYVQNSNFGQRTLQSITDEFQGLRRSNILLFRNFDGDMMLKRGAASGFEFSVRCIPYIVAGHELHHVQVLKERYL
jgi:hypothetical protein